MAPAGALALNLAWATIVLVLVPKQLGLPLLVVAQGLPDLAYLLFISGVVALVWGIARTACATGLHLRARHTADAPQIATT